MVDDMIFDVNHGEGVETLLRSLRSFKRQFEDSPNAQQNVVGVLWMTCNDLFNTKNKLVPGKLKEDKIISSVRAIREELNNMKKVLIVGEGDHEKWGESEEYHICQSELIQMISNSEGKDGNDDIYLAMNPVVHYMFRE